MTNKLMERTIAIGLIIIVLTFNPYIFAGLYIDSTSSFSFIALSKIAVLTVLNAILLIMWIIKIQKSKELSIIPTKIYIPIFLWIFSAGLSTFLSNNRTLSFFGYNSTLENSLIETLMLFVFLFIFVNNIKTKEQIESIVRFFNIGIAIASIYVVIRYMGTWTVGIDLIKDYINTSTFTPTGHYGSLPIIALASLLLSIALIISDIILNREKVNLVIDSITLVITGAAFVVFLNLGGSSPEYIYLITGIIALSVVAYLILSNTKLQTSLIPVFGLILLSVLVGLGVYFGVTKNAVQPNSYPNLSLNASWNIALDSIKTPITKGLFGNGQGTFAYAFDRFKSEDVAFPRRNGDQISTFFTVNAQSPNVEEIRVYQPGSYFLGVLLSQGLLGVIAFLLIVGFTVALGIKKGLAGTGVMGIFSLFVFLGLSILTIFFRYDFILLFLMWFALGIFIVSANEDEPEKNLVIAITGRSFDFNNNLNFILPGLVLIGCIWVLFDVFRIFNGNYYAYLAKNSQIEGKLQEFQVNSLRAAQAYPESDIFIRESVFSRSITLFERYAEIQKKISENPDNANSTDLRNQANEVIQLQNQLISDLNLARSTYPDEYKNYYFAGNILARASEFTNLSFDSTALQYFGTSLSVNPFHPDSYYQAANIQYRNKDFVSALNNIRPAVNYRPQNLLYQAVFADILKENGNYSDALSIYNGLKRIKDENSSNEAIQNFYKNQNIDNDIEEATQKQKEQKDKQNNPTPSPSPTPTPTPTRTPTPSRRR